MAEESTEKLLRIIREADQNGVNTSPTAPSAPHGADAAGATGGESVTVSSALPVPPLPMAATSRRPAFGLLNIAGRQRRLGVDISPSRLHLVLTTSGDVPRLLGVRETTYPSGVTPTAPAFPAFLRREVQALCGKVIDLRIWAHFFSAHSQLQHIRIPKVPAWELYDIVFWRLKKDNPFDEGEYLLDFEVQGQVMDKGVPKLKVLCCLVPRQELAEARSVFVAAGLSLAGLTLASLALERLFLSPLMPIQATSFATLHVGRNWSRIDIFSENNLYLSRVVKTGLNSMAESLVQHCNEQRESAIPSAPEPKEQAMPELEVRIADEPDAQPSSLSEAQHVPEQVPVPATPPADAFPDPSAAASDILEGKDLDDSEDLKDTENFKDADRPRNSEPVFPHPSSGAPLNQDQGLNLLICSLIDSAGQSGRPPLPDLSEDKVFNLILPVCERLSRQVERTIDFNVREQYQERAEVLLLSGDLAVNPRVRKYFGDALGLQTQILDPMDPERFPRWAEVAPATSLGRVRQNLAFALALCDDKHSLNLLRPQRQQEQVRSETRVNLAIYAVTILFLLVCGTFFFLQGRTLEAKTRELDRLDQELAAFVPALSSEILLREATRFSESQAELRQLSTRMEVLALLRDVLGRTPDHIRLFNVRINSGGGTRPTPESRSGSADSRRALVMDGMITGDPLSFETALTGYIMALQRSPLLETPQVHDKRLETGPLGDERLRFVLQASLTGKDAQASRGPESLPRDLGLAEADARGGRRFMAQKASPRSMEPAS